MDEIKDQRDLKDSKNPKDPKVPGMEYVTYGQACVLLEISPFLFRRLIEEYGDIIDEFETGNPGSERMAVDAFEVLREVVRRREEGLDPTEIRALLGRQSSSSPKTGSAEGGPRETEDHPDESSADGPSGEVDGGSDQAQKRDGSRPRFYVDDAGVASSTGQGVEAEPSGQSGVSGQESPACRHCSTQLSQLNTRFSTLLNMFVEMKHDVSSIEGEVAKLRAELGEILARLKPANELEEATEGEDRNNDYSGIIDRIGMSREDRATTGNDRSAGRASAFQNSNAGDPKDWAQRSPRRSNKQDKSLWAKLWDF